MQFDLSSTLLAACPVAPAAVNPLHVVTRAPCSQRFGVQLSSYSCTAGAFITTGDMIPFTPDYPVMEWSGFCSKVPFPFPRRNPCRALFQNGSHAQGPRGPSRANERSERSGL